MKYKEEIEKYRVQHRPYESPSGMLYGLFEAPFKSSTLRFMSSGMSEWEHVSVSLANRCPNWQEMCFVKALFWDDDETVIQFHPPKSEYVNNHNYCLHLWKPPYEVKLPPTIFVGIKGMEL